MTTTLKRYGNSSGKYQVVGTRPIRHDGLEKVTGAAKYGADIQLAGMLHGKILRSPHAHAYIRSIDTSKAEALPGVAAVATAKDFPIIEDQVIDFAEAQGSARQMAEHVMAHDKVLYKGHALAAVAATNSHIAEQALRLIEVEYEVLPTVLTLHDALKEDSPILHDDLTTMFRMERFSRGEDTGVKSNVAGHIQHKLGDIEKGFAEADVIVEREFETSTVHQGYIEPHASTAVWVFCHPSFHRRHLGSSRIHYQGYPHGNRRGLWSQDHHLPRAGGRGARQEERPAGADSYGPQGSVRGHRTRFRDSYPG